MYPEKTIELKKKLKIDKKNFMECRRKDNHSEREENRVDKLSATTYKARKQCNNILNKFYRTKWESMNFISG